MYWIFFAIFVAVCLLLVAVGNPDLKRSLDEQRGEEDGALLNDDGRE